jgi:ubiquinone/menaquinone biosynthesis C-methylase UbiE
MEIEVFDRIRTWISKIKMFTRDRLPDSSYQSKFLQEIKNYEALYEPKDARKELSYETPAIWKNVDIFMYHKISRVTKTEGMIGYIADYCNSLTSKAHILTLGSGPCDLEINQLAPRLKVEYELTAVDINEMVCQLAKDRAAEKGIFLTHLIQDINRLSLTTDSFDVIIAFASLHHFLELDHITKEINRGLKKDGIFVTLDIPTRNGYRLFKKTRPVVNAIMKTLPAEFRFNHYTRQTDEEYIDNDLSKHSFECINSEMIIPCLRKNLREVVFVPAHCIARRFSDNMYGFNFDRHPEFGNAFQQFVFELDEYYLEKGLLKPETFFGVYKR